MLPVCNAISTLCAFGTYSHACSRPPRSVRCGRQIELGSTAEGAARASRVLRRSVGPACEGKGTEVHAFDADRGARVTRERAFALRAADSLQVVARDRARLCDIADERSHRRIVRFDRGRLVRVVAGGTTQRDHRDQEESQESSYFPETAVTTRRSVTSLRSTKRSLSQPKPSSPQPVPHELSIRNAPGS